jgi:myosin heavy subunit
MEHDLTLQQLRSSGVISAVTLARSAFPNRLEHSLVLDRFFSLYPPGSKRGCDEDDHELERFRKESEILLTHALKPLEDTGSDGKKRRAFVLGRTRAYFRAGALEFLEAARLKGMEAPAITIQTVFRGYLARTQAERRRVKAQMTLYEASINNAVTIQCAWRCASARALLTQLEEEARERKEEEREHAELKAALHALDDAATRIQCMVRVWRAQKERDKRYVKLIKSQAKSLKKQKKQRKLDQAATEIQRHLRGNYIRVCYGPIIEKAAERAHLKEKLKKIQKKIEIQSKKREKEVEKLSQGPDLANRDSWEESILSAGDEEVELSEMGKLVEYLQSEHRQLQIRSKTLDGMLKPLRKNFR